MKKWYSIPLVLGSTLAAASVWVSDLSATPPPPASAASAHSAVAIARGDSAAVWLPCIRDDWTPAWEEEAEEEESMIAVLSVQQAVWVCLLYVLGVLMAGSLLFVAAVGVIVFCTERGLPRGSNEHSLACTDEESSCLHPVPATGKYERSSLAASRNGIRPRRLNLAESAHGRSWVGK